MIPLSMSSIRGPHQGLLGPSASAHLDTQGPPNAPISTPRGPRLHTSRLLGPPRERVGQYRLGLLARVHDPTLDIVQILPLHLISGIWCRAHFDYQVDSQTPTLSINALFDYQRLFDKKGSGRASDWTQHRRVIGSLVGSQTPRSVKVCVP